MSNILILGGSGILSSAVCEEAIRQGNTVTCITRGNRDFALPKGVISIHGDVNNCDSFVNNLAKHYDSLLDFLTLDVSQLKYRLEVFGNIVDQYIFVSSATAYKLIDGEISENTPLGNQYWDYGQNKVICEKYLKDVADEYNINYTIVRPYVTYGNTRIPFAVIPNGEYWTLAHRILCGKPILLWDDGEAICTLTHTSDFAKGFVALIGNPKAYGEDYHITSNERLKWSEVLDKIGSALNKQPVVFSMSSEDISKKLPEYKGVLFGDKGRNRIFDNSKIKSVAPEFNNFIPFEIGIKNTVSYFKNNKRERNINYMWDGIIDRIIECLAKEKGIQIDKKSIRFMSSETKYSLKDIIKYHIGRNKSLYKIFVALKKKDLKHLLKKEEVEFDKNGFSHFGINNIIEEGVCFGKDKYLISIGDNVYISKGVKFVNYRPSGEHFDRVIGDGTSLTLRDLGPITILNNVFIASNVTIMPNVRIGENSLILDNSVVFEDIPDNSVVCGNPAQVFSNIEKWFSGLKEKNEQYPWYGKSLSHDLIIEERKKYFFEE